MATHTRTSATGASGRYYKDYPKKAIERWRRIDVSFAGQNMALSDVYQIDTIKAATTIKEMFLVVKTAGDAGEEIMVGYGSDTDYWGVYQLDTAGTYWPSDQLKSTTVRAAGALSPKYFSSADTIDIVANSAITTGVVEVWIKIIDTSLGRMDKRG